MMLAGSAETISTGASACAGCAGVAGTYIECKPPCIPPAGLAVGLTASGTRTRRVSTGRYGRISSRLAPSGPLHAIQQWVPRSPPSTEATRRFEHLFATIQTRLSAKLCDRGHIYSFRVKTVIGLGYAQGRSHHPRPCRVFGAHTLADGVYGPVPR